MAAPRKYPEELRERAIRLTLDERKNPASRLGRVRGGEQLGINLETLRGWVSQAEVDVGSRAGTSTVEAAKVVELERETGSFVFTWPGGVYAGRTITLHWDGTAWTRVPSPNFGSSGTALDAVSAVSPDDAWAVGSLTNDGDDTRNRLLLHWNGKAWTRSRP